MTHPYHMHREHQVMHRRVGEIMKGEPSGATKHAGGGAFSKVTSKTAAEHHGTKMRGKKTMQRYARGGKVKKDDGGSVGPNQQQNQAGPPPKGLNDYGNEPVSGQLAQQGHKRGGGVKAFAKGGKVKHEKGGHTTNIAIVMPHKGAGTGAPIAGAPPGGAPPMGAGPPPMMGGAPGGPGGAGPMPPPPMMHKKGGKVIAGESTKENIREWSDRAKKNSYFRGGAATGVGREEKAAHMRKRK